MHTPPLPRRTSQGSSQGATEPSRDAHDDWRETAALHFNVAQTGNMVICAHLLIYR